jgi:hypothetical protein
VQSLIGSIASAFSLSVRQRDRELRRQKGRGIVGSVKTRRLACISGLIVLSALSFPVAAQANPGTLRNGGYVMTRGGNPTNAVEFVIGAGGTRIIEDGADCVPSSTSVAEGVIATAQQTIPIPQPLPGRISAAGNFSYSATVTLTPTDTQSNVSVTTPFTLTIHFLKPKIVVARRTVVATGTMSAPVACASVVRFRLQWDPSARL